MNATGGLGRLGEAKLALLNDELNVTLNRKENLEKLTAELRSQLDLSKQKDL